MASLAASTSSLPCTRALWVHAGAQWDRLGNFMQVHMAYKVKATAQPWQAEMKADHPLRMHTLLVAACCSLCC